MRFDTDGIPRRPREVVGLIAIPIGVVLWLVLRALPSDWVGPVGFFVVVGLLFAPLLVVTWYRRRRFDRGLDELR